MQHLQCMAPQKSQLDTSCLQVISAAEFTPGAVPLGEAAAESTAAQQTGAGCNIVHFVLLSMLLPPDHWSAAGPPSMQPKPGRVFDGRAGSLNPWQAAGGLSPGVFLERLQQNTEKVGVALVRNVSLVAGSFYNGAKQTLDEVRKRGGQ